MKRTVTILLVASFLSACGPGGLAGIGSPLGGYGSSHPTSNESHVPYGSGNGGVGYGYDRRSYDTRRESDRERHERMEAERRHLDEEERENRQNHG